MNYQLAIPSSKFNPYSHKHTPRIGVLARHSKEIEIDIEKCFHQMGTIDIVFTHVKDEESSIPTSNCLENGNLQS